jgi:glucuronate isomerase
MFRRDPISRIGGATVSELSEDLLLGGETAKSIFGEIQALPTLDMHTHVDLKMVVANETAPDPWAALCGGDHYVSAIVESLGAMDRRTFYDPATDPRDKWRAYAEVFPSLLGNQIRDWMKITLVSLGVERPFNPQNADAIWDELAATLSTDRWRPVELFKNTDIAMMSTTDNPVDSLEEHAAAAGIFGEDYWLPAWRPDPFFNLRPGRIKARSWLEWVGELEQTTDQSVLGDFRAFRGALSSRHAFFAQRGCRLSDYGVTVPHGHDVDEQRATEIFEKASRGMEIDEAGAADFQSFMLRFFLGLDFERGWISQIHFGVARNQRDVARELGGLDSGGDTIDGCHGLVDSLHDLLNHFDRAEGRQHRIFLYSLSKADWEKIAGLSRIFPSVYAGMSWWNFDSVSGMMEYFRTTPDLGAGFLKMGPFVTDARNIYSLVPRTQVYRRCLATVLAEHVDFRGDSLDEAIALARRLCCDRVRELLGMEA